MAADGGGSGCLGLFSLRKDGAKRAVALTNGWCTVGRDRRLLSQLQRVWELSGASEFLTTPIDAAAVTVMGNLLHVPSYQIRRALTLYYAASGAEEKEGAASTPAAETKPRGGKKAAVKQPAAATTTAATEGDDAAATTEAKPEKSERSSSKAREPKVEKPQWMTSNFDVSQEAVFAYSCRLVWYALCLFCGWLCVAANESLTLTLFAGRSTSR